MKTSGRERHWPLFSQNSTSSSSSGAIIPRRRKKTIPLSTQKTIIVCSPGIFGEIIIRINCHNCGPLAPTTTQEIATSERTKKRLMNEFHLKRSVIRGRRRGRRSLDLCYVQRHDVRSFVKSMSLPRQSVSHLVG